MDRWRARGLSRFLQTFHAHKPRSNVEFGQIRESPEGSITLDMSCEQKIAAVIQGCHDIIASLAQIAQRYQRSVLEYAIWYRERHQGEDTYAEYITFRTCHCIVHSDFLTPNLTWDIVRFTDIA